MKNVSLYNNTEKEVTTMHIEGKFFAKYDLANWKEDFNLNLDDI